VHVPAPDVVQRIALFGRHREGHCESAPPTLSSIVRRKWLTEPQHTLRGRNDDGMCGSARFRCSSRRRLLAFTPLSRRSRRRSHAPTPKLRLAHLMSAQHPRVTNITHLHARVEVGDLHLGARAVLRGHFWRRGRLLRSAKVHNGRTSRRAWPDVAGWARGKERMGGNELNSLSWSLRPRLRRKGLEEQPRLQQPSRP